jgi:DNA mismatch repair protein MutS
MRTKLALAQLEAEDRISPARRLIDDLPLFCAAGLAATQAVQDPALNALVAAFAALNPDELSPRDALDALYALEVNLASVQRP